MSQLSIISLTERVDNLCEIFANYGLVKMALYRFDSSNHSKHSTHSKKINKCNLEKINVKDLKKMTLKDLKKFCKDHSIKGYSNLRKNQIIKLLNKSF